MSKLAIDFRNFDVQRKIIVAALLLSGGAPFTACKNVGGLIDDVEDNYWQVKSAEVAFCSAITGSYVGQQQQQSSSQSGKKRNCDPEVGLRDPPVRAGATLSLRGPSIAGQAGTFVRAGALAPLFAKTHAAMPDIGAYGPTAGEARRRETIAVPVVAGISVPAPQLGVPVQNLAFEVFVGASVKAKQRSFSLTEVGLPGVASASQSYTSVEPTVGFGAQYYLGVFAGMPTSIGAHLTTDLDPVKRTISAPSPNFSDIRYNLESSRNVHNAAAITLNFDIPTR